MFFREDGYDHKDLGFIPFGSVVHIFMMLKICVLSKIVSWLETSKAAKTLKPEQVEVTDETYQYVETDQDGTHICVSLHNVDHYSFVCVLTQVSVFFFFFFFFYSKSKG